MRLTCPNCGAQYEVPDEVIPSDGRDVQCSNCGDTWFQNHTDTPVLTINEPVQSPPQPSEPDEVDSRAASEDSGMHEPQDPEYEERTEQAPSPERALMDPSVKNILREEAAHEAQIRTEESGNSIESQPDLGLDDIADESVRRAHEARKRMERIRGTKAGHDAPAQADPISIPNSRRSLLPNIEEINSTLDADRGKADPNTTVGPVSVSSKSKHKRGFTRGFAVAILIAAALTVIYIKAPQVAQSIPQVDPALNAYVTSVDRARLWLDKKIGDLVPDTGE